MKLSWGKETGEFQVKNLASLTVTRAKTDTLSGIPQSTTLRKYLFPLAVFYFPTDTAALLYFLSYALLRVCSTMFTE